MLGLVKKHVSSLHLKLDTYRKYQISLNLKKCIFFIPYGILFSHVVCKQGLMVDLAKIAVIINLDPLRNVKFLHTKLGHTRYYIKFIKASVQITTPVEKLVKKNVTFFWDDDSQTGLDVLKENMVMTAILVFPDWKNEFHVHVDASYTALGEILTQPSIGDINHPIAFARKKLSKAEKNYSTTEWEGLSMLYALHKFKHDFLGMHFKMYTYHSSLKYLVNKPTLPGGGFVGGYCYFKSMTSK